MTSTQTVSTSSRLYTLCPCCVEHNNAKLVQPMVKCPECGQECNCEGCVAEARSS